MVTLLAISTAKDHYILATVFLFIFHSKLFWRSSSSILVTSMHTLSICQQ